MSTTTTLNKRSANKLVLEEFGSGWQTYEPQGLKIFNVRKPERVDEKFGVTAADGSITPVAEGASYPTVDVEEIGGTTHTQAVYKKAVSITKLMKEFDNYGRVLQEAYKLGYRARYTMDKVMADVLNGVESLTTWDGLSIANSNHQVGTTGGTQSNVVTGGLSVSTLNEAYVRFSTMQDHGGQEMPLTPAQLVVHPQNAKLAFELLVSKDKPDTANRSINWLNSWSTDIVVWPILENQQDYYLFAPKGFHTFTFLPSIEPTLTPIRDQNTGNDVVQIDFACTAGTPDYLGFVFGNQA